MTEKEFWEEPSLYAFYGVDFARAIPDPHRQTQSRAFTLWLPQYLMIRERDFWFTLYLRYGMERHDGPRTAGGEQQTAV